MRDFQWLHFSDLHLCSDDSNAADARKSLIKYVETERKAGRLKFDYIFITGDVADKAKYDQSESYLKELFTALGLKITKRSLSKVFWAVGNHDISRSDTSKRSEIIKKIRNPGEKYSLSDGLDEKNREDSGLLLDSGMLPYKDEYKKILKRDLEATAKEPHILKEFPDLNIVVLNTCITSTDDNDTHNLYIQSKHLKRVFESIHDKDKPLFVIGHHGRDFFYMDEMYTLSDVFDEMGVDVYLCGHNHKLGVALFPDTQRDIYQFTCGGGPSFSTKTNFSFMHGAFDCSDISIQITPYSYRLDGDKEWSVDEHLSRRLKPSKKFKLERLCTSEGEPDSNREDYVNILHLSDLQFGITENNSGKSKVAIQSRETILEKRLIDYLNSGIPKEWKPDIVVISGDLAWGGTKGDYTKFAHWLNKLMTTLDLPMNNLIVCTGNHDINSTGANRNTRNGLVSIDKAQKELACNENTPEEHKEIYDNFTEFIAFCRGEIDSNVTITPLENILPDGSDGKFLYGFREIMGLRFNVLNTSWYCGNNKKKPDSVPDKENLWIGEEFVRDLEQNMLYNDQFAVTVFHHPFDWLNPIEGDDNSNVKRFLLKLSDIILCGHVHTQVREPTFEHNKSQIFQSGALWAGNQYTYESRIVRINKRTGLVRQLTLEYDSNSTHWEHKISVGPNKDKSYPINYNDSARNFVMEG